MLGWRIGKKDGTGLGRRLGDAFGRKMCLDLKRGNWSVSVKANQRERCWGHDLIEDLLAHC